MGGKVFFGIAILIALICGASFFVFWQTSIPGSSGGNTQKSITTTDDEKTASKTQERVKLFPLLRAALIDPVTKGLPPRIAGEAGHLNTPFNLLIAGVPGKGNPAPNLTDTIMVIHIDPGQKMVYLFSLPRDLLVRAPDASYYTRLNGLYERGGITSLYLKAEDVTGLEISRYIIVDLEAVSEIVDALGGVNVYVEKDIYDPRFPGNGFSYETFSLKAGWRFLDGIASTRYIRTRNDMDDDFGRMRRQQLFGEALKQKISGLSFVWDMPTFLKVLDSVSTHVKTNLNADELLWLFDFGKKLPQDKIVIAPLDADAKKNLFTTGDFWFGEARASIVEPLEGIEQYEAIREYVQRVLPY
ncbi:MAG: LCP family protein [bacterium]|nr:LCP family protein [bacterium]